jgi:hypothetical protein
MSGEEREALVNAWQLCMEMARRGRNRGKQKELCDRFDRFSAVIRDMLKREFSSAFLDEAKK